MGIVLEDDCLSVREFFRFCDEGLATFRSDSNIAGLGGFVACQLEKPFLSTHGSVWGWASWKDRWCNYRSDKELGDRDLEYLSSVSSL